MKKYISLALCAVLMCMLLGGCGRTSDTDATNTQQGVNFEPETTAVSSGGLMQAVDDQENAPTYKIIDEAFEMDVPEDLPLEDDTAVPDATAEPTDAQGDSLYATPSPQPNTAVGTFAEIGDVGLGFKFSYPVNWNNIPGRSTICYVQPMENGTVYPARVAVSVKKLAHKCDVEDLQDEMILFFNTLKSQYDATTFKINTDIDETTHFMGNNAYSTTYLAYDSDQEIEGYVIMTAFEKYVFCFHFQCAYTDYAAFGGTMKTMRDSVTLVQSELD